LSFAVAIPAHNEGPAIGRTVRSILRAGIPPEDIYVLCNGCTDDTPEEVRKCGVEPVIAPVKGKEETLTWACSAAKLFRAYTHVCFFDADTEVDGKFFKVIRESLRKDATIDVICGKPKSLPHNWLTAHRAVQYWAFHKLHKEAQSKRGGILVVPGCAGVYSTASLRKIVWSPDTRIGDMDATIQAVKLGMKVVFEPRAFVLTQDPATLSDYTSQLYRRWYRGLWMNMRKHGVLWSGWTSPMNWSCRLMFFDQFLPFIYIGAVWYWSLAYSWKQAVAVFSAFLLAEVVACAWMDDRWDIVKYAPIFFLMRVYDSLLFIASSWNIFVRREKSGVWKSPTRYSSAS
jgi:cellulose synthase/poly-beta-1,6-N-acetylglucosamine synthase-like glycosyltransferase